MCICQLYEGPEGWAGVSVQNYKTTRDDSQVWRVLGDAYSHLAVHSWSRVSIHLQRAGISPPRVIPAWWCMALIAAGCVCLRG